MPETGNVSTVLSPQRLLKWSSKRENTNSGPNRHHTTDDRPDAIPPVVTQPPTFVDTVCGNANTFSARSGTFTVLQSAPIRGSCHYIIVITGILLNLSSRSVQAKSKTFSAPFRYPSRRVRIVFSRAEIVMAGQTLLLKSPRRESAGQTLLLKSPRRESA